MKTILILFLLIAACKAPEKCWCKEQLEAEWYRLVDWREQMVYLSDQSPDSATRVESRRVAYRLGARISQVELMLNEIK